MDLVSFIAGFGFGAVLTWVLCAYIVGWASRYGYLYVENKKRD